MKVLLHTTRNNDDVDSLLLVVDLLKKYQQIKRQNKQMYCLHNKN